MENNSQPVSQAPVATQPAQQTAVAKAPKKVDVLKGILNADSVQQQFKNALGKNAGTFVASVIDLYNSDANIQLCDPKQVVMEALKAAVLHLPINKALGYAYIIPFNNSKKDANGNWVKVMEPTCQIGYKGYIQMAMRTGQYKTINADMVYEGELQQVNKLTGEIAFNGERISDKVVGYFCYIELLNGFSKTMYMTVEQMANHAKRYSKGLKKDATVESLMALANMPVQADSKQVGWMGNFHGMAIKTLVRLLLGKYGYLSVEMQNAIVADQEGDSYEVRNGEVQNQATKEMSMEEVEYQDVTGQPVIEAPKAEPKEDDPGY